MTAEQIRLDDAVEKAMGECLSRLTPIEADFVRECLLRRMTYAEFSAKWGLPSEPLTEFKVGTLVKLKGILATKGIFGMGDLL